MSHVQIYKLHDVDPGSTGGCQRINPSEAKYWNEQGFGIFQTVNSFRGARKIENLVSVNAWAIDMDEGRKEDQKQLIMRGLPPTMVVETKRGFQVYWAAKDADPRHWNSIVLDRLVPYYGADKRARDLARILRVPGFLHLKDPKNPFLVEKVWEYPAAYTERQMAYYYADESKDQRQEFIRRQSKENNQSGDFWERVWRLDCLDALSRISGEPCVSSENYSFRKNSNGKFNILVGGKSTSCFVDQAGRIGSLDNGGPTVFQWLRWYGHSASKAIEIMKQYFPELTEQPSGTK